MLGGLPLVVVAHLPLERQVSVDHVGRHRVSGYEPIAVERFVRRDCELPVGDRATDESDEQQQVLITRSGCRRTGFGRVSRGVK